MNANEAPPESTNAAKAKKPESAEKDGVKRKKSAFDFDGTSHYHGNDGCEKSHGFLRVIVVSLSLTTIYRWKHSTASKMFWYKRFLHHSPPFLTKSH